MNRQARHHCGTRACRARRRSFSKKGARPREGRSQTQEDGQGSGPRSQPRPARGRAASVGNGATILKLIGKPIGPTLVAIMKAAGRKARSVRGFISTAKKRAIKIDSARNEEGERVYRATRVEQGWPRTAKRKGAGPWTGRRIIRCSTSSGKTPPARTSIGHVVRFC